MSPIFSVSSLLIKLHNVQADAEPPMALQAEQYNLTTMMVSWSPPLLGPAITGYRIHYASNITDNWLVVDSPTTSALISGLQSGDVYWVSAITLSYFPSSETEAIEIFLCKPNLSITLHMISGVSLSDPMEVSLIEEGPHSVIAGQSYNLTCIATLAPRTDIDWELNWSNSNDVTHENTNLTTRDTITGAQINTLVLIFDEVDLSDADLYTCEAIANYSGGPQAKMSSTILNVESKLPIKFYIACIILILCSSTTSCKYHNSRRWSSNSIFRNYFTYTDMHSSAEF